MRCCSMSDTAMAALHACLCPAHRDGDAGGVVRLFALLSGCCAHGAARRSNLCWLLLHPPESCCSGATRRSSLQRSTRPWPTGENTSHACMPKCITLHACQSAAAHHALAFTQLHGLLMHRMYFV
jgi:hypothetical protein